MRSLRAPGLLVTGSTPKLWKLVRGVALRREDALMESVTRLSLRVVDNHAWVTEFTLALFWRVWDITLRCLG